MVIMLVPLLLFFVGLFSIDQYRTTLIRSEFTALERQGFTLARSLALAEAEREAGEGMKHLEASLRAELGEEKRAALEAQAQTLAAQASDATSQTASALRAELEAAKAAALEAQAEAEQAEKCAALDAQAAALAESAARD